MTTAAAVQHELIVMDESGDTKIVWDPDKSDEVDNAKRTFSEMKKKGYIAYKVDRKGEKGEVMDDFDRNAEKLILAPQMRGG
jgi:hypothetical protein